MGTVGIDGGGLPPLGGMVGGGEFVGGGWDGGGSGSGSGSGSGPGAGPPGSDGRGDGDGDGDGEGEGEGDGAEPVSPPPPPPTRPPPPPPPPPPVGLAAPGAVSDPVPPDRGRAMRAADAGMPGVVFPSPVGAVVLVVVLLGVDNRVVAGPCARTRVVVVVCRSATATDDPRSADARTRTNTTRAAPNPAKPTMRLAWRPRGSSYHHSRIRNWSTPEVERARATCDGSGRRLRPER